MEEALCIDGRTLIDLIAIPSGVFQMGSSQGLPLETPVHTVSIERPFLLGKFPVTQGQWKALMPVNPSTFAGAGNLPVDNVSWEDAKLFCAKLAASCHREVRLPSESEWEYACRAGTTTEFFFGHDGSLLSDYAWFDLNSQEQTHPVGMKQPNPWGLYDMTGNVWEWCEDVWHSDYETGPHDGNPLLANAAGQPRRCLRGGAWNYDAFRCRSAYRSREWKHFATDHFGFRIAVSI
jgi:formylglycine-generating enzyme required for sulfatase activity